MFVYCNPIHVDGGTLTLPAVYAISFDFLTFQSNYRCMYWIVDDVKVRPVLNGTLMKSHLRLVK